MSQGPSTLGTMITLSLSPISVTSVIRSSRAQGESRALTRVHSCVEPKSVSLPTRTSPSRAASLRSTGTASSRLPSTMSAFAIVSGSFDTIFSFEASKKWIIREGGNGISRTGSGAPTHSGLRKSRGARMALKLPAGDHHRVAREPRVAADPDIPEARVAGEALELRGRVGPDRARDVEEQAGQGAGLRAALPGGRALLLEDRQRATRAQRRVRALQERD